MTPLGLFRNEIYSSRVVYLISVKDQKLSFSISGVNNYCSSSIFVTNSYKNVLAKLFLKTNLIKKLAEFKSSAPRGRAEMHG